jgi:glycerol-3-phosphate dehydrogenase
MIKAGLSVYDLIASRHTHSFHPVRDFSMLLPSMNHSFDIGGYSFQDAITDDASLVLKVIQEGVEHGGTALNYMACNDILAMNSSRIAGVTAEDCVTGRQIELFAGAVVNATGADMEFWHRKVQPAVKMRHLRGSHLIFPHWRFPVHQAVSIPHPEDDRPLYILPWMGHTLVGTTDVDHSQIKSDEPFISEQEGAYLFHAHNSWFNSLNLSPSDVISTFSGVRTVVDTGKTDPSKESREHLIVSKNGLISVSGGKLTTFRYMAYEILKKVVRYIGKTTRHSDDTVDNSSDYTEDNMGYSQENMEGILTSKASDPFCIHLDDLMLRRTRFGLFLKNGGLDRMPQIRKQVQPILGWSDHTWQKEEQRYSRVWHNFYSPLRLCATMGKEVS